MGPLRRPRGRGAARRRGALHAAPDLPLADPRPAATLDVGALRVAPRARRADFAGRPLALSRKEFDLLARLALEPGAVVPKARLLRDVWGDAAAGTTRTLDSHPSRLRRVLVRAGATQGEWVVNHRAVGYSLVRPALPPIALQEAA
jgi:DNA-binding response OmpR family regulator